ncbi:MAG: beta-lactamase family protein, partial [Alphaproteobacteria bacterium]|nr:beta-lactamase family protein [Alphaproteobacteria bacterium]
MTRIGTALLTAALLVGTASATPTFAWAQAPLPTAKPEEVGMSAARLGRITRWFKAEIDEKKLPGAVIAVARQGKLVYYEAIGYRDAAKKAPMAKDSIFRIYSMTKPIVSVAAMMLVEDGKIQLTDPVAKFLPDFKDQMVSVAKADGSGYDMVKGERPMTVQDLLRHTSGLAYGEITRNQPVKDAYKAGGMYKPGDIDFDARAMTPAEQNAAVGKAPLAHHPATQWE